MKESTGKLNGPQKVVLYGAEGVGKTTLAAQFPNPYFFDLEAGTKNFDVRRGTPENFEELLAEIVVKANDPTIETIVIDTADGAEALATADVLDKTGKDSIEAFGYGKGYTYLAEKWDKFLKVLTDASNRKHVVVTAHSQIVKFEMPGQIGQFDRYTLRLSKNVAPLLKAWADALLFIKFESILNKDKDTKKVVGIGGTERVIYSQHRDAFDAKNRHDLPEEMPCTFESIASVFPPLGRHFPAPTAMQKVKAVPSPKLDPEPASTPAPEHPLAWLDKYEPKVTVFMLSKGKIKEGQTFRDLSQDSVTMIVGMPRSKIAKWIGFTLTPEDAE